MDASVWQESVGEARVLISERALLHNARVIRRQIPPTTRLCAVVKADAYGHGAHIVTRALCRTGGAPTVDALAVACLDEAAALVGILGGLAALPLMVFRPVENTSLGQQRDKLEEAVRQGWVLTVCNAAAADDLARIAAAVGKPASVQVMIDSGMTRAGIHPENLQTLCQRIESHPSLRLTGLFTHFASADEPGNTFTQDQLNRFLRASGMCVSPNTPANLIRHAANSGAIFFSPKSHLDMVRPGLSLYGIDPSGKPSLDRPLRPALKWTAPLVGVKEIPPGATVGYGQTWRALRRSRVGLLPIGYADGYCRSFSNRAVVMVHNRPAPVIGRVSMDLTTIDLSDIPQAAIGEEATLLDSDPLSPASVYKLAEWAGTIAYEVLCRIGPRVRRVAYDPEHAITACDRP